MRKEKIEQLGISGSLTFLILCVLLGGCTPSQIQRRLLLDNVEKIEKSIQESENHFVVQRAFPSLLVLADAVVRDSNSTELLTRAARMHNLFAMLFLREENLHWQELHYRQGIEHSVRALQTLLKFPLANNKPSQKVVAQLKGLPEKGYDSLFWWTASWVNLCSLYSSHTEFLSFLPVLEQLLLANIEKISGYEKVMAYVLLGGLSRDPHQAEETFEKALQHTSRNCLIVHVVYAERVAVKNKDQDLFVKLLQEVRKKWQKRESIVVKKEYTLVNALAYKRAGELLQLQDELFVEDGADIFSN